MKRTACLFLLLFLVTWLSAQQNLKISKPEPSLSNNTLIIKYDITGCGTGELIDITIIILNSKGDTIRPGSVTGDIGRQVGCGSGKTIQWNIAADNVNINEDIQIFVRGKKSARSVAETGVSASQKPSRGKIILMSALVPGLGEMKATGKPAFLVFSGLVYGSAGAAAFLASRSGKLKKDYLAASGTERDDLYNKWQSNYNMTKYLTIGAAGLWSANIIWSAVIPIKDTRNKKMDIGLTSFGKNDLLVSAKWTF